MENNPYHASAERAHVAIGTMRKRAVWPAQLGMKGPFRILDLPAELILCILSFLGSKEVVLFSLTCKDVSRFVRGAKFGRLHLDALHRALQRDEENLEPGYERVEFLHLLSQDHPRLFMCYRCCKLHQSLTGEDRLIPQDSDLGNEDIKEWKGELVFGPLWPQYTISHPAAFGITADNRATLGPGYPGTQLSISTDWKLARLGTFCNNPDFIHGYVKLDTEAVVVNGSLLFHKTQRILLLPERVKPFFKCMAFYRMEQVFTSCCHNSDLDHTFRPFLSTIHWNDFDKIGVRDTISGFIKMTHYQMLLSEPPGVDGWDMEALELHPDSLAGCNRCTTEYAVTIHNHGRAGVEIILDVFQDFGDSSSPKWQNCCFDSQGTAFNTVLQRRRDPGYGAVDPRIFPTPPGKSAKEHPSAPATRDMEDLHEHERRAMLKWMCKYLEPLGRKENEQGLT
ncbi:hypothetical protein GGS26DRAFT_287353 [Hypomontagnella submonticulosa]|nr:hypothetical protein GGS26DRAFT_287353 [Hypomontagnella submonticulosa]